MAVDHYNAGRFAIAESILQKLLQREMGKYTIPTSLLLMKSTYGMDRYEAAKKIGRSFLDTYPSSPYIKNVYQNFGDIFIDEGLHDPAFRMYIKAREQGEDEKFLYEVDQRIIRTLKLKIQYALVEELLALESDDVIRSILLMTKAFAEIIDGNPDECAQTLYYIKPELVPTPYFELYEQLILASYRPGKRIVTIGVIVPLTGEKKDLGISFLKGLNTFFSSQAMQTTDISYLVYNNRGNDIETIRAVRTMIKNPSVMVIVGPLGAYNSLVAASSIYHSNIPLLIPLSVQDQLTSVSTQVYQLNSNLDTRGRLAARYAVFDQEMETIAVLAPADEYGQSLADAFINEVDRLGKTVVAVEWYSGIPEDLSRQFKALRKVAWSLKPEPDPNEEFLGMTIDSLDAMFNIEVEDFFQLPLDESESLSKSDSSKVILETIDGMYLPIHPDHASYLGTQFPMYNLKTQLIGNENWRNLEILNQENIGPHINGMIIVTDQLIKDQSWIDPKLEDMKYRQIFYRGYDCAQLLLEVLNTSQPDRNAVSNRLAALDEFRGLTHYYSFTGTEQNLNTALQVIRYNRFKFEEVGYFRGDSLIKPYFEAP